MKNFIVGAGALLLMGSLPLSDAQAQDECKDVLANGIFGSEKTLSSSAAKDAYKKWLCASEVQSFQEAKDLGLDSSAEIYDIPMNSKFTYSKQEREDYKNEYCSKEDRAADLSTAYSNARSYADKNLLNSWLQCMMRPSSGLSVRTLTAADALSVSVSYTKHHPLDTVPDLLQLSGRNLSCTPVSNTVLPQRVPEGNGALGFWCTYNNICKDGLLSVVTSTESLTTTISSLAGGEGQPCCSGQCSAGLTCNNGTCARCGGPNEPCCVQGCRGENMCSPAGSCVACTTSGQKWYRDLDKDGYGDASTFVRACSKPTGYVARAGDCDDENKNAHPGQKRWFSEPRSGGSYDYDCNGSNERRWTDSGKCINSCHDARRGWVGGEPKCGAGGTWLVDCDRGCLLKKEEHVAKTQVCR